MIDFSSQNAPKIGPKSLPSWFQRALEGSLDDDSDSKLEKEAARFIGQAAVDHKQEGFGAPGGGTQGGGIQTALSSHAGQPLDKPRGRRT